MWIAIGVGIPVLVLAIWVAVWPVLSRSYRYHSWDHRRHERTGRMMRPRHVRMGCALCAATFEAGRPVDAVNAKNAHVLRSHAQSGGSEAVHPTAVHPTTAPAVRRGA